MLILYLLFKIKTGLTYMLIYEHVDAVLAREGKSHNFLSTSYFN